MLEERLYNVLPLLDKFEDTQAQIEQLPIDAEDTEADPLADFENYYYTIVSHARDILEKTGSSKRILAVTCTTAKDRFTEI